MTEQQKPLIWQSLFLYLILGDLLIITIGIAGRMLLDWQPLTSFRIFFYGAQFALGLAALGLLQLLYGLYRKNASHKSSGALTLLFGLLPVLLAVVAGSGSGMPFSKA